VFLKSKPPKSRIAGLFAYQAKPDQRAKLRDAAQSLLDAGWTVLALPALKPALTGLKLAYVGPETLAKRSSVLVSLGGDGTLLGAARLAAPLGKKVLSVNLGGLGFMTALGPEALRQRLPLLLANGGLEESRRLARAELWRSGKKIAVIDALNDLVLGRSSAGRLARLQASIDGRFLAQFRADGLIFATPTGSTAYALSVGGPVIDARTPVLLLALVSPHTLSNRPLVLPESSRLDLELPDAGLELSADGAKPLRLRAGDRLRLMRSPYQARLIFPKDHDNWAVLRDKLGWQGLGVKGKRRA
jgi:NAD+ kinase